MERGGAWAALAVGQGVQAAEAFALLLLAASLVGMVARRANLPTTVALVLCGIALAATGLVHGLRLTPGLVLFVFLPGLLFEAAFHLHLDVLRRVAGAVLALAGPGVLITLGTVAAVLHVALGLPWEASLLVGAMVGATDPIAVLAVFRRLGVPDRLSAIVEGESLFNDGVSLVAFALALRLAVGGVLDPLDAAATFVVAVAGGVGIGAVLGFAASHLTRHVDDHLVEMTLTVALAYGAYILADLVGASGVLATIAAGLVHGNYGRVVGMSPRTREALDDLWEYAAYLLNALVFLLLGTALDPTHLLRPAVLAVLLATLLGRALAVYGLAGIARLLRAATIPRRWRHMVFWSGLRGALSLAMALSLPASLPRRELLIDLVAGVVLITIVVQGGLVGPLARRLLRAAPEHGA